MKIYFDESYPNTNDKMILGAVFVSKSGSKFLRKKIKEIKHLNNVGFEIKYSKIKTSNTLKTAKEIVAEFFNLNTPYFCARILPYSEKDLKIIPGKILNHKRVGVYSYAAKKLVLENMPPSESGDLVMDHEDRIERTKFRTKALKSKSATNAKISSVLTVNSETEEMIQLTDLLTGAILQSLYPTNSKSGKYKKEFGEFVRNLTKLTLVENCQIKGKFKIQYQNAPNFYAIRKAIKRKKSRS